MAAIALATMISMMGQGVVTPILPTYARNFGVGTLAIGLVVGAFGFSRLFLNIPAGIIGQRYGRTVLMSSGLAITAAGNFGSGFAGGIEELIAWRVLAGAGSAMFMTGAMAYVADIATPQNRGRLMSIQMGSLLLGVDIGPLIGGVVADNIGLDWPFYVAGGLAAIAAVWTALRLPNRPPGWTRSAAPRRRAPSDAGVPENATDGGRSSVRAMLSNPTFVIVGLFTMMVFFTRTGSRLNLVPLIATDEIGMSSTTLGLLLFVITTINFLIVWPAGWLADRIGRKPVMVPGIVLVAAGLVAFAWASSVPMMFAAAVLQGIGTGVTGPIPAAYIADLAPPGRASMAMGLYRTFGDVGFVVGPVLLGWIAEIGSKDLALSTNAVLVIGVGLLVALVAKETAGRKLRRQRA